jgi:signal transduction histidine kinase
MTPWRRLGRRIADLFKSPPGSGEAPVREMQLRTNLRRIRLIGVLGLLICILELVLGHFRVSIALQVESAAGFIIIAGFMALAGAALNRRLPPRLARALPVAFVFSLLCLSVVAAYLISLTNRLAFGYGMTSVVVAAVFFIPPRRFATILAATFALYTFLLLVGPLSAFDRSIGWFNTAIVVSAAMVIRIILNRIRQRERRQVVTIARQKRALQRRHEELETSNRELNEVMALAAHDLRSPLLTLRSLLNHVAQRDHVPAGLYRDVMREGSQSLSLMLDIVGRLLQAHESENQPMAGLDSIDLREAVRSASEAHALAARNAGIVLHVSNAADPVTVWADQEALSRILANLLSNAFRFSPPGSKVEIRCQQDDGRACISVADQGCGIPPHEGPRVFQKFHRGGYEPVQGRRGTGLGLYIAARLSASMGASIAHAPGPGGGTVFSLGFPPLGSEGLLEESP